MTGRNPQVRLRRRKPPAQWTEISVLTPISAEEAITHFLIEERTTGMEELDVAPGWKRLKAYFPGKGRMGVLLRRLLRFAKALRPLHPELRDLQVETRNIVHENWGENWKRFFKPQQISRKFLVGPPWATLRPGKGQIPIWIHPGMAFGTGTHATTKLCMQALEEALRGRKGTVLDVGTGSGILAIAAAKGGARRVVAIDVDPVAIEAARENVKTNGVLERVRIRTGGIGNVSEAFDLVVANIDKKSLRRMRKPLVRRVKRGGLLILSGILCQDEEDVRQFYLDLGILRHLQTTREGEWSCLGFRRG